jgi:hypothetical protein
MEIFTLPRFTIERGIDVVYSEVKYLHCMLGEIVNKNIGESCYTKIVKYVKILNFIMTINCKTATKKWMCSKPKSLVNTDTIWLATCYEVHCTIITHYTVSIHNHKKQSHMRKLWYQWGFFADSVLQLSLSKHQVYIHIFKRRVFHMNGWRSWVWIECHIWYTTAFIFCWLSA